MNILIITDYEGSWPYIPEFKGRLINDKIDVDILDTGNLKFIGCDNKVRPLIGNSLKLFFNISIFRLLLTIIILKIFFLRNKERYDILNIHFISPLYIFLIKEFNKIALKKVASVWGSDFYRTNRLIKDRMSMLYDSVDAITFLNPQTQKDFEDYYKKYGEKSYVIRFGLESTDIIKEIISKESIEQSKQELGIPPESFIVVCGYNSSSAQQHEKMIELLLSIKGRLPPDVFVLLPMTYPPNSKYISHIEDLMNKSDLPYKIFKTVMNIENIARLRLITDIAINMQTTDQLSASIQEHLYAGNIVITGRWLPYGIYEEMGIFFFRAKDSAEFANVLEDCIVNYDEMRKKCIENTEIIYNFACWSNNIKKWINFYKNLLKA